MSNPHWRLQAVAPGRHQQVLAKRTKAYRFCVYRCLKLQYLRWKDTISSLLSIEKQSQPVFSASALLLLSGAAHPRGLQFFLSIPHLDAGWHLMLPQHVEFVPGSWRGSATRFCSIAYWCKRKRSPQYPARGVIDRRKRLQCQSSFIGSLTKKVSVASRLHHLDS